MAVLLAAGCGRIGYERLDGGGSSFDGGGAGPDGAVLPDGRVVIPEGGDVPDGALPDGGTVAPPPLCTVGPAPESPPPTGGGEYFVRASTSAVSFCVMDAPVPDAAWGDAICEREAGPGFWWRGELDPGGGFERCERGAVYGLVGVDAPAVGESSAGILLMGKPMYTSWGGGAEGYNTYNCNVSYAPDGRVSSSGTWHYPGTCLPPEDTLGRLWCVKEVQPPVVLDAGDLGALDAVYDPLNQRYVVVYEKDLRVYLTFVDPYGKAVATPVEVEAFDWAAEATPRIAFGRRDGAARYAVVWQRAYSGAPSGVEKRFAVFDDAFTATAGPAPLLPFESFNSDGSHAVAFDSARQQFLFVSGGNGDADDPHTPLMNLQRTDAQGTPIGTAFALSSFTIWGFTHAAVAAAYHPTLDQYLLIANREAFVIPGGTDAASHHQELPTRPSAPARVVANPDTAEYVSITDASGGGWATLRLAGDGRAVDVPRPWTTRIGGHSPDIVYFREDGAGAMAGRLLVSDGPRFMYLYGRGERCFPAYPREVSGGGPELASLVGNEDTGGFARFAVVPLSGTTQLTMRIFLSNGDEY